MFLNDQAIHLKLAEHFEALKTLGFVNSSSSRQLVYHVGFQMFVSWSIKGIESVFQHVLPPRCTTQESKPQLLTKNSTVVIPVDSPEFDSILRVKTM